LWFRRWPPIEMHYQQPGRCQPRRQIWPTKNICKPSRGGKSRCAGLSRSPLPDSNRRPPPYHAIQTATGGSQWQRFGASSSHFGASGGPNLCHPLRPLCSTTVPSQSAQNAHFGRRDDDAEVRIEPLGTLEHARCRKGAPLSRSTGASGASRRRARRRTRGWKRGVEGRGAPVAGCRGAAGNEVRAEQTQRRLSRT